MRYTLKIFFLVFAFMISSKFSFEQWNDITPNSTAKFLHSTYFTDEEHGFVVGQYYIGMTQIGLYMKTTDGGLNWDVFYTDTMPVLTSVFFTDSLIGFIGGENGKLYKTFDGGISWLLLNSSTNSRISDIFFLDQNNGFITAGKNIYKTTDGGINWDLKLTGNSSFYSITFIDSLKGFVSGCVPNPTFGPPLYPTIHKTIDGGSNWVETDLSGPDCLSAISFPSLSKGYAMGQGGLFATTNDIGNSWLQNNIANTYGISSMKFVDSLTGFAAGRDFAFNQYGFIIKTTDGGDNWANDLTDTVQAISKLFFPSKNIGYAVGGSGSSVILKFINDTIIQEQEEIIIDCFKLINLSPVPAETKINMRFISNTSGTVSIDLFNSTGQKVYSISFEVSEDQLEYEIQKEFDMSSLSTGIYFLNLQTNCNNSLQTIIISK